MHLFVFVPVTETGSLKNSAVKRLCIAVDALLLGTLLKQQGFGIWFFD